MCYLNSVRLQSEVQLTLMNISSSFLVAVLMRASFIVALVVFATALEETFKVLEIV